MNGFCFASWSRSLRLRSAIGQAKYQRGIERTESVRQHHEVAARQGERQRVKHSVFKSTIGVSNAKMSQFTAVVV